jgi:TetR/AcrR family fatty acid metabolism transcriptional regulator
MTTRKAVSGQQKRKAKKYEIFTQAMKLFIKKGYNMVTVDEICQKVGISKGSFYYYYPSKGQIIMTFFAKNDQIYSKEYKEKISKMDSCIEKLKAVSQIIHSYIEEQGLDVLRTVYSGQIEPSKKGAFSATNRPFYKIGRDIMRDGQKRGEFRRDISPEEAALFVMMSLRGVAYEWCLRNGKFNLQRTAQKMLSLILESLKAK